MPKGRFAEGIRAAGLAATAVLLAWPPAASAQARRWEIVPKPEASLKAGKLSVVGGMASETGVSFVVNNLEITRPVEVALAAQDPRQRLELVVYKDAPGKPLLERATSPGRAAVARFRTAESVQLLVKGPAGAKYQLMTWVGPRVVVQAPPAFVPVAADGSSPRVAVAASRDAAPSPARSSGVISVLLGLILLALVVIAFLLSRGRSRGTAGLLLVFFIARPGGADQEAGSDDLAPRIVEPVDVAKEVADRIEGLRELIRTAEEAGFEAGLEELKVPEESDDDAEPQKPSLKGLLNDGPDALGKAIGKLATGAKLGMALLEQFGLIDPREAAVQPNYDPPGQPLVPSRCAGTDACGECFAEATVRFDKARRLLEDQYVIYKQTEFEAGRIHELAGAAADLSGFAKLAWTVAKANPREPMNVAQRRFYDLYDGNVAKLLDRLNTGLIAVGACERQHFQDFDWYPRYGIVYYNFMKDRYTRK
jgi:hypothetical protein